MIPIKLWLHLVLSNIQVISDRNYQYENWVKANNPKIFDFYTERMAHLFDDADVENFIKHHAIEAGLDEVQRAALSKIVNSIDKYDGSKLTDEEILKDPNWIKITDMAKEVLKVLPKDTYVEEE
jgi:hypothetical protein